MMPTSTDQTIPPLFVVSGEPLKKEGGIIATPVHSLGCLNCDCSGNTETTQSDIKYCAHDSSSGDSASESTPKAGLLEGTLEYDPDDEDSEVTVTLSLTNDTEWKVTLHDYDPEEEDSDGEDEADQASSSTESKTPESNTAQKGLKSSKTAPGELKY